MRTALSISLLVLTALPIAAQTYDGSYSAVASDGSSVSLTLQQSAQGLVTGTVQGVGRIMTVEARLEGGALVGRFTDQAGFVFFRAQTQPAGGMRLAIYEPDARGQPNVAPAMELDFAPSGSAAAAPAPTPLGAVRPTSVDPFVGTFSNGQLTLTLQGSGGQYAGTAQYQGQTYPVTVGGAGATLTGTFTAPGGQYAMRIATQGTNLIVTTDDATFLLERTEDPMGAMNATAPLPGMMGDELIGYFFSPPAGWQGQKAEIGYVLGSTTKKGLMIILPHELTSLAELQNEARMGVQDEGIMLTLDGDVTQWESNGVTAAFKGVVQGQPARAHAIGLLSPFGGGVTVLAMVDSASFGQGYVDDVETMARGVVFRPPVAPAIVQEWDAELRGRKLTHMESYYSPSAVEGGISGGYSQNIDMALCSDGTFYYDDASVVSAGNTGINALGQGGSGARGQWSIAAQGEDAILEMRANSGETWSYTITWQDKLVHLNDRKFFRVENDWCR